MFKQMPDKSAWQVSSESSEDFDELGDFSSTALVHAGDLLSSEFSRYVVYIIC